jgi:hypothetical protein
MEGVMPIKIDCPECGGSKWMEGSTPSCMGGAKVPCEYCTDGKITVYTQAELDAEREACAEVCMRIKSNGMNQFGFLPPVAFWNGIIKGASECAQAIRQRSK